MAYRFGGATALPEACIVRPSPQPLNWRQWSTIGITLVTLVLWGLGSLVSPLMGEMGCVAIVPLVALFGLGLLNRDDFQAFLWSMVMLAMGGLALGEAVKSSGLLATMAQALEMRLEGYSVWLIIVIFSLLILLVTTFISHTVGALILLPLMKSLGESLPGDPSRLLVFAGGMACSAGMGLPISSFPNLAAGGQLDGVGRPMVRTGDFLKTGLPASLFITAFMLTLGYALMLAVKI